MRLSGRFVFPLVLCTGLTVSARGLCAGTALNLEVDASDLPRKLLHSRIEIPASGEHLVVWYPKWLPGVHAPGGPVQNIGGLRFEAPGGKRLNWRRDDEEPARFVCDIPQGVTRITALLDYICNQPSANSAGVDSFGNSKVGILNWNTCLLYPEEAKSGDTEVSVRLKIPSGWKIGTSLKRKGQDGDWIQFQEVDLAALIDSPVLCGAYLRTIDISTEGFPPHFLHLASEAENAIEINDDIVSLYRKVVVEAKELFGKAHYPEYHFLVTLSNELPKMGVEHLASSVNGVEERALLDEKKRKDWAACLLPHEFSHSWCGKYRRPRGMVTSDFHTPQHTELLWIYEGLTQYLGEVLTVRSGILSQEEYLDRFTGKVDSLMHEAGRQWRPLEDTAVANYTLREHSPNWGALRRGQDYYNEGLLLWLEVDTIIRRESDGTHSLDEFCKEFLGRTEEGATVVPYDVDEVYADLQRLADYDWKGFFTKRVSETQEALPLDVIGLAGYQLRYTPERSKYVKEREEDSKKVSAADSLGLEFNETGAVTSVIPGMIGDKAGIAPGMTTQGVNGRKFTGDRLRDALADSIANRKIEVLILEGDRYRNVVLDYADGPKYLEITRDESKRDILSDILKKKVEEKEK